MAGNSWLAAALGGLVCYLGPWIFAFLYWTDYSMPGRHVVLFGLVVVGSSALGGALAAFLAGRPGWFHGLMAAFAGYAIAIVFGIAGRIGLSRFWPVEGFTLFLFLAVSLPLGLLGALGGGLLGERLHRAPKTPAASAA